jgi:hypothetical protein
MQMLHGDESVGRGDDEVVKGYYGWMWVVLERTNYLHFVPSKNKEMWSKDE